MAIRTTSISLNLKDHARIYSEDALRYGFILSSWKKPRVKQFSIRINCTDYQYRKVLCTIPSDKSLMDRIRIVFWMPRMTFCLANVHI